VTVETQGSGRGRVTALLGANAFFAGSTFASTINYASIVGIDVMGIPNAMYSLVLVGSALVSAFASVALGYLSDRIPDRRILVIACGVTGAMGLGLVYFWRTPLAFIICMCAIAPFGSAIYSQSFAFARAYYNEVAPHRAEFMNSVIRTIFSMAWAVVPPAVGWLAAATTVFNIYLVAASAYLACALIFVVIARDDNARVGHAAGTPRGGAGHPKAAVDPVIFAGIGGIFFILMAVQINNVSVPLLITSTLEGSYGDLGTFAGLAAAIELPFMLLWGYALRWIPKHTIIVCAALLYALYLYLLSRAGSVSDILWLQLVNGPATAALVSIPISYTQDAIRNRVGLSTSLLDVVRVSAVIAAAGLFALLTGTVPNYPLMFATAAALASGGAVVLFAAHRVMRGQPAAVTSR
jgi:MFS family permease